MKTAVLSVKFDEDLKKEADGICRQYGTTLSGAIRMFVAQVVRERRLPLNVMEPLKPQEDDG